MRTIIRNRSINFLRGKGVGEPYIKAWAKRLKESGPYLKNGVYKEDWKAIEEFYILSSHLLRTKNK